MMKEEHQDPIRLAYERRNRDLDPQLVWRGKDEQDWSDLVVQAPPLYIQEKVHPKVLLDDLKQLSVVSDQCPDDSQMKLDLFSDFNGIPEGADKTDFYQHDQNWSNRMILGDSLQVMASLAEREGLRGKVQCIYFDPPYGIKFNSNFQWSTTSRDVKDGNAGHITREPEQVKAFRDTWRDGIHSYLTYLRDRLTVARDLLTDSGSIFVQIGDENVHRVRALMDEVFGEDNYQNTIYFQTTGGFATTGLSRIGDYVIWYSKNLLSKKHRPLFNNKAGAEDDRSAYKNIELEDGVRRRLTSNEATDVANLLPSGKIFRIDNLCGQGVPPEPTPFEYEGIKYNPTKNSHWKPNYPIGLTRLAQANRIYGTGRTLNYVRFIDDYPVSPFNDVWTDTGHSGFAYDKLYVVQTATTVIQRCILMTTDPGDLVLDPTCGSGTTAYVAEQWGRRWITIDTSRVALALARARIMGARYPYYLLADTPEGRQKAAEIAGRDLPPISVQCPVASDQSSKNSLTTDHRPLTTSQNRASLCFGFVYERVPHIMLRDIANNTEIDVIWEKYEEKLKPVRLALTKELPKGWLAKYRKAQKYTAPVAEAIEEWEVPREVPSDWAATTEPLITAFWKHRIARQKAIDASIASKSEFEYLYDKPYEDRRKVRVAGPFTVESISPHRMLGVDENDELLDATRTHPEDYEAGQTFAQMILENLKSAGVQQAHKEDKINFTSLTPWPGNYICAEGRFESSGQYPVTSDQGSDQLPVSSDRIKNLLTTDHRPLGTEYRAAIFVGPEFGTVSRPDLVDAAREAADASFDVLIACAFNYEAHTTEFDKLGRLPILKARMNADLHMADDLKNTGHGNLFVIFGEPDISVTSDQWLVTRTGRKVTSYELCKELSGLGSLAEINNAGRDGLSTISELSTRGALRHNKSDTAGSNLNSGEHSRGSGEERHQGVSSISQHSQRVTGRDRNIPDSGAETGASDGGGNSTPVSGSWRGWPHGQRTQALTALKDLTESDFPLALTTDHWSLITVNGIDVFHPNSGEIRSDGPEGIACWFVDTDYNGESFFVRHAYFLGANDPYKSLKTTLKAEINKGAWETLNSDTSRPFPKPTSGRIAVKVINHLGDEVMKVYRV